MIEILMQRESVSAVGNSCIYLQGHSGKMATPIRTQNKLSPKFPVNFNVSIRFCCVHYATGDAAVKAG